MQAASRAVFMGSKTLGLTMLRCLHAQTPGLQWTIVHPDDAADARSILGEFKAFANANNIALLVPSTSRDAKRMLAELRPDVGFVCGWYWLLDAETFGPVPRGLWGMHNSLLPKYRGGAPLVWSIINGDEQVGSTVFRISEGMDDGDILCQVAVRLEESTTIADALTAIEAKMVEALPAKWSALVAGQVSPTPQDESQATYCGQRAEGDGLIDWNWPADVVHNFVRAQAPPYPGAFAYLHRNKVTILRTAVFRGVYFGTPGQVLRRHEASVLVACGGNTAIELLELSAGGVVQAPAQAIASVKDRFTAT